jgi:hypothetical protein
MRENLTYGLRWQGMEKYYGEPKTGTKLETVDTAKVIPKVTRHSLTLPKY